MRQEIRAEPRSKPGDQGASRSRRFSGGLERAVLDRIHTLRDGRLGHAAPGATVLKLR